MFSGFSKAATARLLSRSGSSTAKMRTAVSRSRRTSLFSSFGAPCKEVFNLFIRHGLPPVSIENSNFAFERSQRPLFASRLLGAHDVHDRHTPAADGHGLPILHRLNQLRQFVLGICDADLHVVMIAI